MTDDIVSRMISRFDHHDPEFAGEGIPQQVYAALREKCPVTWTDAHDGFWVVSRYDDIDRVALDPETFSSTMGNLIPHGPDALPQADKDALLESRRGSAPPVFLDPPLHGQYRRALNPLFNRANIRPREPYIRSVADDFIDALPTDGSCELIRDYCAPIPAIVVLDWLGLPVDGWKPWSDAVLAQFAQPEKSGPDMSTIDMESVMRTIHARKADPRDDVLSALTQITVDGEALTEYEMMRIVAVVIFAGLDTTTNAVATSLVELQRRPELRAQLVAADNDDPLWTSAVEELLRFTCPVQGFRRTTRNEAELGGQTISPGDRVLMMWASGNFDENVFDNPHELDLRRPNNSHMSFGRGIHRCLGSHLARLEMTVMLQQFLHRVPDYTIDESRLELHPDAGIVVGYGHVPTSFPTQMPLPRA